MDNEILKQIESDLTKEQSGDQGAYCGRFGSSPHSLNCATLCTERKIDFAINKLIEIQQYDPYGDDHMDNFSLTMKFIEFKLKELETMKELINL